MLLIQAILVSTGAAVVLMHCQECVQIELLLPLGPTLGYVCVGKIQALGGFKLSSKAHTTSCCTVENSQLRCYHSVTLAKSNSGCWLSWTSRTLLKPLDSPCGWVTSNLTPWHCLSSWCALNNMDSLMPVSLIMMHWLFNYLFSSYMHSGIGSGGLHPNSAHRN